MSSDSWVVYYDIASNVFFLLTQMATTVCLSLLCRDFLKKKRHAFMTGTVYFIAMTVLYYIPVPLTNFTAYLAGTLAALFAMCCIEHKYINTKIFVSVTFFAFRWMSVSVTDVIVVFISNHASAYIMATQTGQAEEGMLFTLFCGIGLFRIIIRFAVLLILVSAVRRLLKLQYRELSLRETLILCIPPALGMLNYVIVQQYDRAFEQDAGIYLGDTHQEIQLLWAVCQLLLASGVFVELLLFRDLKEKQEAEKEHCVLQNHMAQMHAHIQAVEQIYTGIRGIRHDLNQHISVTEELLAHNEYAAAKEYLEKLRGLADAFDYKIKTGHPVTDAVLNEKAQKAALAGIHFASAFCYPVGTNADAFDLSILLGNALDNALEAAGVDGAVKIRSFWNKNAFFIKIYNTYKGEIPVGMDLFSGMTSKPDNERHGFGIKNMRSVAQKYFGGIELTQQGSTVVLTAMLMLDKKDKTCFTTQKG